MAMQLLHQQHVLVLGLGISGLSMARWCLCQGARVTVADTRAEPPHLAALRSECPEAAFRAGPFDARLTEGAGWTLIARSPGLAPAELQPLSEWARGRGVPLLGELDLFAQALQALSTRHPWPYAPKVLAITGTNGKTTVTALTALLLQRCGVRVAVAGNIGPALLDVLSAALDAEAAALRDEAPQPATAALTCADTDADTDAASAAASDAASDAASRTASDSTAAAPDRAAPRASETTAQAAAENAADLDERPLSPDDDDAAPLLQPPPPAPAQPPHLPAVWVLELSSFQLDGTAGGPWDAVPSAATVLNLSEDHLDWHGSMAAYAAAKAAVFGRQALMLLNRDDGLVMRMMPATVSVKTGGRYRQQLARPCATFGLDAPALPGDWGVESVNGMDWLVRAVALDETRQRGRSDSTGEAVMLQRLMPAEALRIRGRHNAANALAALALAGSTGAALAPMLHGLREYRGEPHRVEPVGVIQGVEYFDDSKGTNVGATLAAVKGLGAERRLVVILGGDGKGQDFAPLADPLCRHARAVLLIGRDAPLLRQRLAAALASAGVALQDAATLPDAVQQAAALAQSGDAVLLSPACASLDMFRDYKHRAAVFVEAVGALALEQGVQPEGSW